jgi:hypothetical protein
LGGIPGPKKSRWYTGETPVELLSSGPPVIAALVATGAANLILSKNDNSLFQFLAWGEFTASCSFSGIRISATAPARQLQPEVDWYVPYGATGMEPIERSGFVSISFGVSVSTDPGPATTIA